MKPKLTTTTSSIFLLVLFLLTPLAAQAQSSEIRRSFDFRNGALGWQADFVGYTQFNKDIYELLAEIRALPSELGVNGSGYYLQGHNRCDCLIMFLKRRLGPEEGVVAGQGYRLSYTVRAASNAQNGCVGIGGAPGESVRFVFGGSQIEPVTFVGQYDTRRMNVESTVASLAGNIANGQPCNLNSNPYVSIERTHVHTKEVTANSAGELWMFVGTGSGFEGRTRLYYQKIDAVLTPVGTPLLNPVNPPTLLTEEGTQNVLGLNALTFTRGPFPFYTRSFLSFDERTHLMLFAVNTELADADSASAVTVLAEDAFGLTFQLPVESVRRVPNLDWLTQIVVTLPSELIGVKDVGVSFNLRGAGSNKASLKLVQ